MSRSLHRRTVELVWGAHDWIAALYIRDRVQHAVDSRPAHDDVPATVQVTDELFRSFTTPDERHLLQRLADDSPREPWWWGRIPKSGPVASDLSAFAPSGRDQRRKGHSGGAE
jgi:hypothetical protein